MPHVLSCSSALGGVPLAALLRWKHRPCPEDILVWWRSQTGQQTNAARCSEDSDGGGSWELRNHTGGEFVEEGAAQGWEVMANAGDS